MKKFIFVFSYFFYCFVANAQTRAIDSLSAALAKEKIDSNKVTMMWKLAQEYQVFRPDTALIIAREALNLAKKISYLEGESRSLGIIASSFDFLGNYPRAMEFYLEKLKLEEKRNNPRNYAGVLNDIGVDYILQEQYLNAQKYFSLADSVVTINKLNTNVIKLKRIIMLNLGEVYYRQNIYDSAIYFFRKALEISTSERNMDYIGMSLVGLANVNSKLKDYEISRHYYFESLPYLQEVSNEDGICEATIGLANLYEKLGNNDSAVYFARISYSLAQKDGFQSRQMDAAVFLTNHYKITKKPDSAFAYMEQMVRLKDSINSKDKIRESQLITMNEQLRQIELAELKMQAKRERIQQLQLLFIGIFIPGLFLLTLLLSRRKIHIRVIRFLGIISLLILFEYLTLLLHPYVIEITHHTPVLELIIFVSIAAILIPGHHRLEHWLIEKLTRKKRQHFKDHFSIKLVRIKIKRSSH